MKAHEFGGLFLRKRLLLEAGASRTLLLHNGLAGTVGQRGSLGAHGCVEMLGVRFTKVALLALGTDKITKNTHEKRDRFWSIFDRFSSILVDFERFLVDFGSVLGGQVKDLPQCPGGLRQTSLTYIYWPGWVFFLELPVLAMVVLCECFFFAAPFREKRVNQQMHNGSQPITSTVPPPC